MNSEGEGFYISISYDQNTRQANPHLQCVPYKPLIRTSLSLVQLEERKRIYKTPSRDSMTFQRFFAFLRGAECDHPSSGSPRCLKPRYSLDREYKYFSAGP